MGLLPVRWTVAVGHLPSGIVYNVVGTSGHVYVSSSSDDPDGVDRLLVFSAIAQ